MCGGESKSRQRPGRGGWAERGRRIAAAAGGGVRECIDFFCTASHGGIFPVCRARLFLPPLLYFLRSPVRFYLTRAGARAAVCRLFTNRKRLRTALLFLPVCVCVLSRSAPASQRAVRSGLSRVLPRWDVEGGDMFRKLFGRSVGRDGDMLRAVREYRNPSVLDRSHGTNRDETPKPADMRLRAE